jgi:hypothetical protein
MRVPINVRTAECATGEERADGARTPPANASAPAAAVICKNLRRFIEAIVRVDSSSLLFLYCLCAFAAQKDARIVSTDLGRRSQEQILCGFGGGPGVDALIHNKGISIVPGRTALLLAGEIIGPDHHDQKEGDGDEADEQGPA